jgi:long-subunit fatty acid transport protein
LESVLLESSWTYGFFSLVDRGGEEKNYHNSVFGGLGARWQFHRKMTASAGFAHDWAFREDVARLETEFDMPTSFYTAGLGLQATSRLRLDAGVMLGLAEDQNGVSVASGAPQKMSQEHVNFGLGLQWSP